MNDFENLPLPLPLDSEQQEHMEKIRSNGFMIASPGTHSYEVLSHLVDRGLLIRWFCANAMGVYQFELSTGGGRND